MDFGVQCFPLLKETSQSLQPLVVSCHPPSSLGLISFAKLSIQACLYYCNFRRPKRINSQKTVSRSLFLYVPRVRTSKENFTYPKFFKDNFQQFSIGSYVCRNQYVLGSLVGSNNRRCLRLPAQLAINFYFIFLHFGPEIARKVRARNLDHQRRGYAGLTSQPRPPLSFC